MMLGLLFLWLLLILLVFGLILIKLLETHLVVSGYYLVVDGSSMMD